MHSEPAIIFETNQQVLPAPLDRDDLTVGDCADHLARGGWLSPAFVEYPHRGDPPAHELGLELAADCLYLRKLRHPTVLPIDVHGGGARVHQPRCLEAGGSGWHLGLLDRARVGLEVDLADSLVG